MIGRLSRVAGLLSAFAGLPALLVSSNAAVAQVPVEAMPWSAPAARPTSQDLIFTSGQARLSGTLWLPAGRERSPVVIVYHSASDALRSAALYQHLIAMLPPIGIGVFVYDRRGSGASSGPSANGSFPLLADDGIAARRMLERVPGVDQDKIGYWGLSQGGWLAALAAERDPNCAFAVSISAPMVTADVQMRFAVANILRIRGFDQSVINQAVATRLAIDDFMRGKVSRPEAQRKLDRAAAQPWFQYTYLSRTFKDPSQSGWAREISNDPLSVVEQVSKPILLLYGSADPWVPVQASLERLSSRKRSNLTLHVIAGADHAMMTSATPLAQVEPDSMMRQSPESPEYFGMLADWLSKQGLTATRR